MNAYEQVGRERKAQGVARAIWRQLPRELRTNPRLAETYAKATPEERRGWAEVAAEKPVRKVPSDLTWSRVTEILAEKVADERRWLGLDESRPVGQQRAAS